MKSGILALVITATANGLLFPLAAQEVRAAGDDTARFLPAVHHVDTVPPARAFSQPFKPIPGRAAIYSAVFPGLGQIYNRKYWKLPLVYGGFMGFIYAVSWNNKNYRDYADAYYYVEKDSPDDPDNWNGSWISFVPAGRDPADYIRDANFKSRLKNGKDFYRRYRDLSIILTVGWYLICMADAYVDAQLFDFDISDDLSMRLEPVFSPRTAYSASLYGVSFSINF
ncbi:MAG: DUF5683 domain-containing protein [Tannerella sp.]|nr:DUF5683 domain-containing protein [Tannerella sp.]